jgi:hypothetical protein
LAALTALVLVPPPVFLVLVPPPGFRGVVAVVVVGGVGVVKRKVLGTEFIEQFGMDEQSLAHLVKAVLDVSAGQ